MKARDIYEKYKIIPSLQEHMLRVACVSEIIMENCTIPLDTQAVIEGALLHDLGNILKTPLTLENTYIKFGDKDLVYWQSVQDYYKREYGIESDIATAAILEEINVSTSVKDLLHRFEFRYLGEILDASLEKMILKYSDLRVGLKGVLSFEERMKDIEVRYGIEDIESKELAKKLEISIFNFIQIAPEDITFDFVEKNKEKFLDFEIRVKQKDGF